MKIEYIPPTSLMPEQRVEIEVKDGDWAGIYTSRIRSVAGRDIELEGPIQNGMFVPLRPETALIVRAVGAMGLLTFDTTVVDRRTGAAPSLIVERPARVMCVQRRTSYRVSTSLPILVEPATDDGDTSSQSGILVDLSGGGAALRSSLALRAHDWLRLRLPGNAQIGAALTISAQVVAVETRRARFDTERVARLRFSGLSQNDEDRIFRLVNQLERGRLRERRALWERLF